jgi:hypothetical protein
MTEAVRSVPAFGAATTRMEPSPVPEAGATLTHGASLEAVQAHCACVRTSTDVSPPAAPRTSVAVPTWNRQAAASCETSTCRSLIEIVARRVAGAVFSATR